MQLLLSEFNPDDVHRTELEKKLNLNEQTLIETKDTLKRKTKVHLDLEDMIQKLSLSLSDTKMEGKQMTMVIQPL